MNVDAKQRYLMVAEAAYFRAQQRNFAPGHEHEDWLAAERQVDEMLKNLAAVPMQAELQQATEAKPTARQVRKQPAKTASKKAASAEIHHAKLATTSLAAEPKAAATTKAKPARKQQAKAAAPSTEAKPIRTRRAKAAAAPAAAGTAGTASVSGTGAEKAAAKPKKGERTKAASAEPAVPTKRVGRPRKATLH